MNANNKGFFDPEALRREKHAARERDDADLREGRVTAEQLRLRNGLFSGIDLSRAVIRVGAGRKRHFRKEILSRSRDIFGEQSAADRSYRMVPIPLLEGQTAEALVEDYRGSEVVEYLRHLPRVNSHEPGSRFADQ